MLLRYHPQPVNRIPPPSPRSAPRPPPARPAPCERTTCSAAAAPGARGGELGSSPARVRAGGRRGFRGGGWGLGLEGEAECRSRPRRDLADRPGEPGAVPEGGTSQGPAGPPPPAEPWLGLSGAHRSLGPELGGADPRLPGFHPRQGRAPRVPLLPRPRRNARTRAWRPGLRGRGGSEPGPRARPLGGGPERPPGGRRPPEAPRRPRDAREAPLQGEVWGGSCVPQGSPRAGSEEGIGTPTFLSRALRGARWGGGEQ